MKKMIITILLIVSSTAIADEFVQFNDGSTAWREKDGFIWGKTPSPKHDFDSNENSKHNHVIVDTDGTTYVPSGNGYINTQTGQFVP